MTGTIAGTVVDSWNSQPVDGATIAVQPGDHTTTTAGDGKYSVSLDGGTYAMTVTHAGYQNWIAEGIFVMDGATTEIDIALSRADY